MEESIYENWVPGTGDTTVRQRLVELEEEAGTIPVLFALFLNEALKGAVGSFPILGVVEANYFLTAFVLGCLYVYRDRKKRLAQKAKDKVKEARTPKSQSKLREYES